MTIDELIADLEKATKPCERLDKAIHRVVAPDNPYPYYCPRYTSSIDQAVTLVPKGAPWLIESWPPSPTRTVTSDAAVCAAVYIGEDRYCSDASTPAIALCIAALEARRETT